MMSSKRLKCSSWIEENTVLDLSWTPPAHCSGIKPEESSGLEAMIAVLSLVYNLHLYIGNDYFCFTVLRSSLHKQITNFGQSYKRSVACYC